jgi:HSF-type DNA-binding
MSILSHKLYSSEYSMLLARDREKKVLKRCVAVTARSRHVLRDNIYLTSSTECEVHSAAAAETSRSGQSSDKERIPKVRSKVYCKPGRTAKHHKRIFVVHDYHDHSQDEQDNSISNVGNVSALFPLKLHEVLEAVANDGQSHIISWAPHGRCFTLHMPEEFVDQVLRK